MGVQVEKRLFTIDEYNRMGEAGILEEKGIELIQGEIIKKMSPINESHASCINRLNAILNRFLLDKAIISIQNPIVIPHHTKPEPDLTLLRFREDYYHARHPQVEDIILLIEVSDSTLAYDREVKLPLYAEAGIPEYWIINLEDQQIEAHHNPSENTYQIKEIAQKGDQLQIPGFDSYVEIDKVFMN